MLVKKCNNKAGFVLLIDPDKITHRQLKELLDLANYSEVDNFFIGSSQPLQNSIQEYAEIIKKNSDIPLYIFPGETNQLTDKADGIMFISLLSGRDPRFLIESHVKAAPYLANMDLKILPTGYILLDSERKTTVEERSLTSPLSQKDIPRIIAHCQAAEMLGKKYVYLEAGSGALSTVSENIISAVKESIKIPLIVGGGIRDVKKAESIVKSGADFIVVGNYFEDERNWKYMADFVKATK